MEKNKKRWVLKPHGAVTKLVNQSGLSYRCVINWVNNGGVGANEDNDETLRYLMERNGFKLLRHRTIRRRKAALAAKKAKQAKQAEQQPTEIEAMEP